MNIINRNGSTYTCHSGGCPGADMTWENEGYKYGIKTIAYSFYNHVQEGKNPKILTSIELGEGFEAAKAAEKTLKRNLNKIFYPYVKNLISRNWFQVKNSSSVFAIGTFLNSYHKLVNGGTGWAVQMGIDNNKEVFFFNQEVSEYNFLGDDLGGWYKYNYELEKFEKIDYIPTIPKDFAGIGTRKINDNGYNAIREILNYNFKRNADIV